MPELSKKLRNSETALPSFVRIDYELKLKNLWTKNVEVTTAKHTQQKQYTDLEKTVDVYDDLCNVFKKVQ